MTATLRTDFNDFLFSPVAADNNGMHLTLLSVLARTGVDPWLEAADLAALSRESATQKLVSLLAGVPNGPSPGADAQTLASRLVALLHARPAPKAAAAGATPFPASLAAAPQRIKPAIYSVLALVVMLMVTCAYNTRDAQAPTGFSVPVAP